MCAVVLTQLGYLKAVWVSEVRKGATKHRCKEEILLRNAVSESLMG
jgi:hypothetical protein